LDLEGKDSGRKDLSQEENQASDDSTGKERNPNYPVSDKFKVLEGYDIYRSSKLIVALVVVDGNFGRDLRLYRWQMRNDTWKVDLCRMSVADWKWDEISRKARDLTQRYEIKRRATASETAE
jgi:hypothetical protein